MAFILHGVPQIVTSPASCLRSLSGIQQPKFRARVPGLMCVLFPIVSFCSTSSYSASKVPAAAAP